MTTVIWPFLVGRARTAGHRDVVVPGLLSGTALAGTLAAELGSGQATETLPRGYAYLQELRRTAGRPLCAVFRLYQARRADFDLGEDVPLLDGSSRPIMICEGFLAAMTAPECGRAGFTAGDLDLAHASVVPAYQRFWQDDDGYQPVTVQSANAIGRGEVLVLRPVGAPLPSAGPNRAQGPIAGVESGRASWAQDWVPVPPGPGAQRPVPARPPRQARVPLRFVLAAIAGAALIAGGVGYAASGHGNPPRVPCMTVTASPSTSDLGFPGQQAGKTTGTPRPSPTCQTTAPKQTPSP